MRKIKFGYDEFILTLKILSIVVLIGFLVFNFVVKPIVYERTFSKKVIENIDFDALYENRHMLEQAGMECIDDDPEQKVWCDSEVYEFDGFMYIAEQIGEFPYRLNKKLPKSDVKYGYIWWDFDYAPDVMMSNNKMFIVIRFGDYDGKAQEETLISILRQVGAYKEDA